MFKDIPITAETRSVSGTTASRALRRSGRIPANVNRTDGSTAMLSLSMHSFEQMLRHHAGESLIAQISIDNAAPLKALLKHVQHEPLRGGVVHVDFMEIGSDTIIRVTIPVELTGVPVGVSIGSGILEHSLREIEVECLPDDLVEKFTADISSLQLGQTITVSDLKLGDRYKVVTPGHVGLASVHAPRVEKVEVAAEPGAEAAPEATPAKE